MAKLVDALPWGGSARKGLGVRISFAAQCYFKRQYLFYKITKIQKAMQCMAFCIKMGLTSFYNDDFDLF